MGSVVSVGQEDAVIGVFEVEEKGIEVIYFGLSTDSDSMLTAAATEGADR